MQKVLITAIDSFTGTHLSKYLQNQGFDVVGTTYKTCDILNKTQLENTLKKYKPDYIVHLAGIASPAHSKTEEFYSVNTVGAINLLETIVKLKLELKKCILVSSATVYGNQNLEVLHENLIPKPASHYGASKLTMEILAHNYFDKIPMIITRPFNYTGVGQSEDFLIPKIVQHYKENKQVIELGNLDVKREFNNVLDIAKIYKQLLLCDKDSIIVNLTSQNPIALMDVITIMNKLSGYEIEIKVNPKFVRKDEIKSLCGSNTLLTQLIDLKFEYTINDTLTQLYKSK